MLGTFDGPRLGCSSDPELGMRIGASEGTGSGPVLGCTSCPGVGPGGTGLRSRTLRSSNVGTDEGAKPVGSIDGSLERATGALGIMLG